MPALAGGPAAAAKVDKAAKKRAKRYEKRAKKAYARKRWEDAIVAFELAYQAWPQPKYQFNIGRCYENTGDLFKAMEHVQAFVDAVTDEAERQDAQDLYAILRGKLMRTSGELVVRSTPPGATVKLEADGKTVTGETPLTRWLAAGTWKPEVSFDGHETARDEVAVAVGKTVTRELELLDRAAAEARRKAAEEARAALASTTVATQPPRRGRVELIRWR